MSGRDEIAIGWASRRRGLVQERPPFRDDASTTSMPRQVSEEHDSGWVYATTASLPVELGSTPSPGMNACRSEP